jgi:alpha-glucoside transport system substrate-binding protein
MIRARTGLTRLAVALSLVAAGVVPVACAPSGCDRTLEVIGNWTGTEATDFGKVLDGFHQATGCTALYHGSQSLDQELQADVQQGDPPDLAMLSSPGELQFYADQGDLRGFPLDDNEIAAYPSQWRVLEEQLRPRDSDPTLQYAIVFKADLKSAVWYDPEAMRALGPRWTGPPTSWAGLTALSSAIGAAGKTPWCLGMEATPNSGWPGTDWIEDILLHQSGVSAYQDWANGRLSWLSAPVQNAWNAWGALLSAQHTIPDDPAAGAAQDPLLTNFAAAGTPMFGSPPGCYLDHKASFVMSSYQSVALPGGGNPQPAADYAFFPFPSFGGADTAGEEVSADIGTVFRSSQPADQLIAYLASTDAQRIWPGIGSAFSVDSEVALSDYADPEKRQVATMLTRTTDALCFDASDLMPPAMSTAFTQAVLRYLIDPGSLPDLLAGLDQVRAQAYGANTRTYTCGGSG